MFPALLLSIGQNLTKTWFHISKLFADKAYYHDPAPTHHCCTNSGKTVIFYEVNTLIGSRLNTFPTKKTLSNFRSKFNLYEVL
jgi:hypothetical protein